MANLEQEKQVVVSHFHNSVVSPAFGALGKAAVEDVGLQTCGE